MTLTSVVNAEPTTKEFTVEGTIKYDGEDVVIKGKVTYTHEIYSKLQIDGADKGMYVEGDTVTITAEDAPEGKHFAGWTVVKGNVTLADANSSTTTFVMGNEEVEIKANYEVNTYTIEVTSGENGKVSPAGEVLVEYGKNLEFTITANTGYHIEKVVVDGEDKGTNNTYTFTNVKENHTIDVTFAIDTFTITTKTNDGGSISEYTGGGIVTGNTTVKYNDNAIFTITPNTGYGIVDVTVDGTSIGAKTSYEFKNVIKNHTIEVVFGVTSSDTFVKAVKSGGTIELAGSFEMEPVTLNTPEIPTVINLNGFGVDVSGSDRAIYVTGDSELIINNGHFGIPITVFDEGKLVLNNVHLKIGLGLMFGNLELHDCTSDSFLNVRGGSLIATGFSGDSLYVYNNATVHLTKCYFYDKGNMDDWLESSGHQVYQTKDIYITMIFGWSGKDNM